MSNNLTTQYTQQLLQLQLQIGNGINSIATLVTNAGKFIFANPQGKTPAQVVAGLGTNAASVFQALDAYVTFINAQTGGTLAYLPTGTTYTANQDGTVTLSQ